MKRALLLALALAPAALLAQEGSPEAKPRPADSTLLNGLLARNVGPATMGGRVVDLAVYEKEPRIFYVATSSAGVWRTDNGGITLRPVFNRESNSNIGAIAVSQNNPDLIYVATGEGTSRNSSGWGNGVYRSTDGGKSWQNVGLQECRHFHKVIIDPRNDNVVYLAGLGDLWGYNEDRGVYKTTDGGRTWNKILYIDEKTGIADLVMDPKNPNTLLAASWEKLRTAHSWTSGGPGSGLYKTTDAGKTWRKIEKGLPPSPIGRIGLSYFRANPKIVIATVEHNPRGGQNGFYRSTDGGESWAMMSGTNPRPFYFSMPRHDPVDENRVYVPGVQLHYSDDQGKNFRNMRISVHVDFHAMWINPEDNNHIIVGQDGGVGQSRDRGATWEMLNHMDIGEFYGIAFDMRKPYWVYGGLQDNGSWATPTQTNMGGVAYHDAFTFFGGDGFHVQVDPEDWTTVYAESQGGNIGRVDMRYGGTTNIRPRAQNTTPPPAQGETWRWNWSTPIVLSPHNSKTVYVGANKLFRSVNRGDNWEVISPDLTTNDPEKTAHPGRNSVTPENTGAERHCTIITISESPIRPGVIWVGTDDGLVHVTQDGGQNWTNVTENLPDLPKNTWCSRVHASNHVLGRAYATFDGHRNNDYSTYVYVTEDFGKTWSKLNGNLPPHEPTYVIREGLRNPHLLFLGTEFSLWVSLNRGLTWERFRNGNFPTVPVHDLALHPRDGDLVIGTHGRSIYILPISPLEDLTPTNLEKDVVLSKPMNVFNIGRISSSSWQGDRKLVSPNTQPGTLIAYYLREEAKGPVQITITDAAGVQVAQLNGTGRAGLNAVSWNARARGRVVPAGDYGVVLRIGDTEHRTSVTVEDVSGN
jgi:photosystem II stability/assembly factor-like uncharacterized protein